MLPIKDEVIQIAFDKETDIHKQLNDRKLSFNAEDRFWRTNYSREFHLPDHPKYGGLEAGKVGDIWRCDFLVNGRDLKESYAIWRDYPNYYGSGDGKSMEEVLEASETEKILYTCDEFRIVLLRDEILPGTDSYWGFRIQDPVYALIDNKTNEVIVREEKKWRFRKLLMETLVEQEPTKLYEFLKLHNPFKLFIVNSTDREKMEHIQKKLEMWIDTPTDRHEDYINKDQVWVCYILGYGGEKTWWFLYGKEKPTNDEALQGLADIISWYDVDSYVEMLERYREFEYDLNKIDLRSIELKWEQVHEKLQYKVKNIFQVNEPIEYVELVSNFESF